MAFDLRRLSIVDVTAMRLSFSAWLYTSLCFPHCECRSEQITGDIMKAGTDSVGLEGAHENDRGRSWRDNRQSNG